MLVGPKPTDTWMTLPLAVNRFVQDGVDNIAVKATIAVNGSKGRVGQHSENVQIVIGAQDDVYVSQICCLDFFRAGTHHHGRYRGHLHAVRFLFNLGRSICLPCMPNKIPSCWKRSGVSFPEGTQMSFALKYWTMRLTRSTSSGNLA